MGIHGQDTVFSSEAIRDTADHFSTVANITGQVPKSILIVNGLDKVCKIETEGSDTSGFTNIWAIGTPNSVPATTNDYVTIDDYFPFMRVKASCTVAPTSGSLTVHIEKLGQ